LDGFGGGLITEQVAVGRMGNALDAAGLLLCVEPALAWFVKIVKGPVAGIDAVLEGAADRGLIKSLVHELAKQTSADLPLRVGLR
jgi:hypothetical protein